MKEENDGKNKHSENIYLDSLLAANFMPRPRIDRILEKAAASKLVYIIAGAGHGKTKAVHHYMERQTEAVIRWVQLSESDNIGSRYWENLTHTIGFDNPDLAVELREFGFPETLARFKQFANILKTSEHRATKTFLVLDDFHLIHSEQALAFAERCANLQIPGACVILISRKEPDINSVPLFSKGQMSIVTEDDLRFTDSEIADFLKRRGIPFSAKSLPLLFEATKGWALAVQLLSMVLARMPASLDLALGAMKQNIFKLMEAEAFSDFPEKTQKMMVRLSLVSNLPLTVLQNFFHDSAMLQSSPQLAAFVWFDGFTGESRVHPQYWEFLKSKHHILSEEEKRDTYRRAAIWCSENNFHLDAMYYYSQLGDYQRMLELLFSYPFKLPPDTCEYYLGIIGDIDPGDELAGDINALLLKHFFVPLLLMGMGRYGEAKEKAFEVIREWEFSSTPIAYRLLYASYSNLVYIDTYICTFTHEYNSPEYFRKSKEYFELSSLPLPKTAGAFRVADIRSFACLVGEGADPDEIGRFQEAVGQTAVYIAETPHSMYHGYDDLVACELAFYRNRPELAKSHAHRAILKARERKQYSIEAMAEQYLLRVSMQEGDYPMTRGVLKQLRAHLDNPDFWNRQLLYDLFTGFFYAQIGLPGMVPSWLVMDENESTSEVRIPARELVVAVKSHIASKKYDLALTVLHNSYPREANERFLLSELVISLLTAAARVQTGDLDGAAQDFKKAYALSMDGEFEMPFIEMGKFMRPLAAAAAAREDGGIPDQWLRSISRKASIYSKKINVIMNSFKGERRIKDSVELSPRELEVLADMYHGLSREEIAENRYLSVNTVKKILQSIYIKLDANSNIDAVRIAIEKKLIGV